MNFEKNMIEYILVTLVQESIPYTKYCGCNTLKIVNIGQHTWHKICVIRLLFVMVDDECAMI